MSASLNHFSKIQGSKTRKFFTDFKNMGKWKLKNKDFQLVFVIIFNLFPPHHFLFSPSLPFLLPPLPKLENMKKKILEENMKKKKFRSVIPCKICTLLSVWVIITLPIKYIFLPPYKPLYLVFIWSGKNYKESVKFKLHLIYIRFVTMYWYYFKVRFCIIKLKGLWVYLRFVLENSLY